MINQIYFKLYVINFIDMIEKAGNYYAYIARNDMMLNGKFQETEKYVKDWSPASLVNGAPEVTS